MLRIVNREHPQATVARRDNGFYPGFIRLNHSALGEAGSNSGRPTFRWISSRVRFFLASHFMQMVQCEVVHLFFGLFCLPSLSFPSLGLIALCFRVDISFVFFVASTWAALCCRWLHFVLLVLPSEPQQTFGSACGIG